MDTADFQGTSYRTPKPSEYCADVRSPHLWSLWSSLTPYIGKCFRVVDESSSGKCFSVPHDKNNLVQIRNRQLGILPPPFSAVERKAVILMQFEDPYLQSCFSQYTISDNEVKSCLKNRSS